MLDWNDVNDAVRGISDLTYSTICHCVVSGRRLVKMTSAVGILVYYERNKERNKLAIVGNCNEQRAMTSTQAKNSYLILERVSSPSCAYCSGTGRGCAALLSSTSLCRSRGQG